MLETTPDLVTGHGTADRLGNDKAGTRRLIDCRLIDQQVNDDGAPPGAAATANRCGEVCATPQSVRRGQHDYLAFRPDRRRLRPTACRGPWLGGRRGRRGRHGCACAAGNRGSSHAGGCSAGRCACSRLRLRLRTTPRGHRKPKRHFSRARQSNRSTLRRADAGSTILPVGTPTWLSHACGHWSFCATGESFRSRERSRGWAAVDATAGALLACPSAGHSTVHIPPRIGQNRIRR